MKTTQTDTPNATRLSAALALGALGAAAALTFGAGSAAADRDVCECAHGEHTPHATVPGDRDDFSPQQEPPGHYRHGSGGFFFGHSSGGGAGRGFVITDRIPVLIGNHSLVTARLRGGSDR